MSGVLFLQVPSPASPMTFGDPRGMPPAEDFEQFQHLGDLGVDAEVPWHQNLNFFAAPGDIVTFTSHLIHKAHPRTKSPESRVALAFNCEYPQHSTGAFVTPGLTQRTLKMWDGWERGHRGRLTTAVAHGDADTFAFLISATQEAIPRLAAEVYVVCKH